MADIKLTAELTPIKAYRCRINGKDLGHVVEAGELHGIVALVHETGATILVDMPQGLSAEFSKTLGSIFGLPIEAQIIKLSPSLMASALETP